MKTSRALTTEGGGPCSVLLLLFINKVIITIIIIIIIMCIIVIISISSIISSIVSITIIPGADHRGRRPPPRVRAKYYTRNRKSEIPFENATENPRLFLWC